MKRSKHFEKRTIWENYTKFIAMRIFHNNESNLFLTGFLFIAIGTQKFFIIHESLNWSDLIHVVLPWKAFVLEAIPLISRQLSRYFLDNKSSMIIWSIAFFYLGSKTYLLKTCWPGHLFSNYILMETDIKGSLISFTSISV